MNSLRTSADNDEISSNDSDDNLNEKFKKLQEKNDNMMKKISEHVEDYKPTTTEFEEYKSHVFNKIIEGGLHRDQIESFKNNEEQWKTYSSEKAITPSSSGSCFLSIKRSIPNTDNPKYFFEGPFVSEIGSLPQSGSVPTPWSSSYWPTRNGGISVRYGKVRNSVRNNYIRSISTYSQPRDHRIYSRRANYSSLVNSFYSPAEKYDLAVGDTAFTLTNWTKNEGKQWVNSSGDIPTWYGICHGWAMAAYMYKRPYRPVTVTASDGKTRITFFPDDIKGLASQYLATAKYKTKWIGAKCNFYKQNAGWFSDPNCRSVNPGAFLITLGNRVGLQKRSLVIDPEADPEVWNQPVKAYSVRYYNVFNNQFSGNPYVVRVSTGSLRSCGSQWCRQIARNISPSASSVVGAIVRLTYTKETDLVHSSYTLPDKLHTDTFDCAIELDGSGNIVGGEWKHILHPNFMWAPDEDKPIESVSDKDVTAFGGSSSELSTFTKAAATASAQGQLLRAFIRYLIDNSS